MFSMPLQMMLVAVAGWMNREQLAIIDYAFALKMIGRRLAAWGQHTLQFGYAHGSHSASSVTRSRMSTVPSRSHISAAPGLRGRPVRRLWRSDSSLSLAPPASGAGRPCNFALAFLGSSR